MFEQTFVEASQHVAKPYTIFASTALQALAVGLGVLLPLLITQSLPSAALKSMLIAPPPPVAPKPPAPVVKSIPMIAARSFQAARLTTPVVIPHKIASFNEAPPTPDLSTFGAGTDQSGAGNSLLLGSGASAPAPPPSVAPEKSSGPRSPLRVGGQVAEANLIHRVDPVYPPLARQARVQGTVEFSAVISKEGRVERLQLVRGHPLLVNAAREAIVQWRYRPTMLNGQPVEVVTSITVNFTLAQ